MPALQLESCTLDRTPHLQLQGAITEQIPEPADMFQPAIATDHQTAPPPEEAWHGSEAQILSNLELQTAWMPLQSPPAHTKPQAGLWQYLNDWTWFPAVTWNAQLHTIP